MTERADLASQNDFLIADNASGNQKIVLRGKISTLSHEINSLAKHKKALSTLSA